MERLHLFLLSIRLPLFISDSLGSQALGLEVLVVMDKVGLVLLVHLLAGLLHVLGQSRRATAEHAHFMNLRKHPIKEDIMRCLKNTRPRPYRG